MVTGELNAAIYPYPWGERGQEQKKRPHTAGAVGFPQVPQDVPNKERSVLNLACGSLRLNCQLENAARAL